MGKCSQGKGTSILDKNMGLLKAAAMSDVKAVDLALTEGADINALYSILYHFVTCYNKFT